MPENEALTAHPKIRRPVTSLTRLFAFGSAGLIVAGLTVRRSGTALLLRAPDVYPVAAGRRDNGRAGSRKEGPLASPASIRAHGAGTRRPIAWSAHPMIGLGSVDEQPVNSDREVSVFHWNVLWGGGFFRGPARRGNPGARSW